MTFGVGVNVGVDQEGGVLGFDGAAVKAFAAMTVQPSNARKILYNNIIVALKSPIAGGNADGLFAHLDELIIIAAHDSQAGQVDLISGTQKLVLVGGPSFTVDQGYSSDGVAKYMDTGFKPSTAVNFKQNDGIVGPWARDDNLNSTTAFGAQDASTPTTAITSSLHTAANNTAAYRINQAAARTLTNGLITSGIGLTVLHRDAAAATGFMKNGVRIGGTGTDTSVAPVAFNLFLGAVNQAGTAVNFTTHQFAVFVAGGGFGTGTVRDANHLALYNALNNNKWW
jgi:hypothetical protein